MNRTLVLMRHGLATGQAPDAVLQPEGEAQVARLGRLLRGQRWAPDVVLHSPYRRARQTVSALTDAMAWTGRIDVVHELVPEAEPDAALEGIEFAAPGVRCVLAVAHLPLLDRLLFALTGETPGFSPGTFVEVTLDATRRGRIVRRIEARDLGE